MEFATIFTEMNWISMALLCVGLVFVIVEVFVPGFGFFGISGFISLALGVVARIIQGVTLTQALTLILMVVGSMLVLGMFMVFSARFGILGETGLFENNTTLSYTYNKPEKELKRLIGKSGKAITNLSLAGKAKIKGKVYDVISVNSYIQKGMHVKVVEIKNGTPVVRKWFE